jgi:serine phosphatase RsbU (regulator of sigma subunit)
VTTLTAHPERMSCMEVWGGNGSVDGGAVMAGLDAWIYSRPYRGAERGGDVYYISSCATGRITRLLVADVSGHGDGVAQTSADLRRLMQKYVNHIEQRRFVIDLNREFGREGRAGGFATAVVATFFAPTNELALSSAGHPPPLRYSVKEKRWSIMDLAPPGPDRASDSGPADIPLGVVDAATYGQRAMKLAIGDLVLCYTDAAIEARDGSGRMLGPTGLQRLVAEIPPGEPAAILPALRDRLGALAPGNLEQDDLTLLLFRPNGLAPRVPFFVRAAAPLRVAWAIVLSAVRRDRPAPWPELGVRALGGALFGALNRHSER